MKKLLLLATLFLAIASANAQGGPGNDPAAMRQKAREMVKPLLMEKTKITAEQAEKVLDINSAASAQRRELRTDASLSDEDRAKKMAAIDEETAKKYKAIPLTDEQSKAVTAFFEEMRKNRQNGPRNGN